MRTIRASAPAKIILLGEHAAVYGRPALISSLGLRFQVTMGTPYDTYHRGDPGLYFIVPEGIQRFVSFAALVELAEEARAAWQKTPLALSTSRPDQLLEFAFGVAIAASKCTPNSLENASVSIDSNIPIGAGFGSSAALASAVAGAWFSWAELEPDFDTLESVAAQIEQLQHGRPSGIDHNTILQGGTLLAEYNSQGDRTLSPQTLVRERMNKWRVFHSGAPKETTAEMIQLVQNNMRALGPLGPETLNDLEVATGLVLSSLKGDQPEDELIRGVRTAHRALKTLGVVPEAICERIRLIERAGGAAKISGAGGIQTERAGALLVYHEHPGRLDDHPALDQLAPIRAPLGVKGLQLKVMAS